MSQNIYSDLGMIAKVYQVRLLESGLLLNLMRQQPTLICVPVLDKVDLKHYSLNLKRVLRKISLRFYLSTESSKPKMKTVAIIKLREDVWLNTYL